MSWLFGSGPGLSTGLYLVAAMLFIQSLGGLSQQTSARRGNLYGVAGMLLAIGVTIANLSSGYAVAAGALAVGTVVGAALAQRVAMTSMPELVAVLHSFVGLAAVFVGFASYLAPGDVPASGRTLHLVETFIGVLVGAVTFTGSLVAFGKLRGSIGSKPFMIPARHAVNALALASCLGLLAPFILAAGTSGLWALAAMTGISSLLGAHLVMAIGGADMPVVVSVLNSYSGWAAAAAGFMLGNDLLITTGALVGSSGLILSIIMCRAMNRSIVSVIFGGFGAAEGAAPAPSATPKGETVAIDAAEVSKLLAEAKSIVVVPGYGMAVAKAQHPLYEIAQRLRKRGKTVRFAIHPVAGRLPGHMNVLLAEARVPYDVVLEMDEVNPDLAETDVVLVVGANDIVNPSALDDPSSPIYGMPVLEVWRSKRVVVTKRGMAAGYAGIENPLFFHESCRMLFGDAKKSMDAILAALPDR
ncbi:MAG: NAD(P)(+) transhydrogenase (Re/Si-specific) subunit beta [Polyangiaceae bacterium]